MNNNKSTFVTVVAWIFIVGSGLATFISLLQNVMFYFMFRDENFTDIPADIPSGAAFMFEYMHLIVFAFFLICLATLVTSIGLLKRKNWARLLFIVLMCLGVIWSLGGIGVQALMFSSMTEMHQAPDFEEFHTIQLVIQGFTVVISIGFAVLFGWIIKKLISEPIRQEFVN